MLRIGLCLIFCSSSLIAAQQAPAPASPPAQRPNFAGTWVPAEPERSDVYFKNGVSWIPGTGRLVIEQRPNRLTVTAHIPDDILDRWLASIGQHYPTVMYRIVEPSGRGGFGAGGDLTGSWQDGRLFLHRTQAGSRLLTTFVSLDGDRLKIDRHTAIAGKESTLSEWFVRSK